MFGLRYLADIDVLASEQTRNRIRDKPSLLWCERAVVPINPSRAFLRCYCVGSMSCDQMPNFSLCPWDGGKDMRPHTSAEASLRSNFGFIDCLPSPLIEFVASRV